MCDMTARMFIVTFMSGCLLSFQVIKYNIVKFKFNQKSLQVKLFCQNAQPPFW